MESRIHNFRHLDQIVSDLFELALVEPYQSFKKSAFKIFAEQLNADSGVWITRAEQQIPFYEQDALTLNLPEGFIEDYHGLASVSQQVQQIFGVMLGNLGHTKDILDIVPSEDWLSSDMYKLYCEKYQLHHSLMTITVAPQNQLMNIITLARHHPEAVFSERDKRIKEFLVPNLCAALRMNILSGFHNVRASHGNLQVVVDHYGNLIEANDDFWSTAEHNSWITQGKINLPQPIPAEFYLANTCFNVHNIRGLLYLEASLDKTDKLSKRQQQTLTLVQQGYANKEIASMLSISEATVKNHIKAILKIYQCSSREQLIAKYP